MNWLDFEILQLIYKGTACDRQSLKDITGHCSLVIERSLEALIRDEYLTKDLKITEHAEKLYLANAPKNAIILAAGFGMRMVPINLTTPKGLLEVAGEPLIERLIRQLHEAGVEDITVVTGFMKEKFEYLESKYGVSLTVNEEYTTKNNLHSLALAVDKISNTYIVPSDIWCDKNPFRRNELFSWYMVSDLVANDSSVRVNRRMELDAVPKDAGGNEMIGISYILEQDAAPLRKKIKYLDSSLRHDDDFWELALYKHGTMKLPARIVSGMDVVEIDTYEQLRELDGESNHLKSDALDVIAGVFGTATDDIVDISVLKKGMTNRSFLFSVGAEKYIMRIPGEGTDQLINRKEEAMVYDAISGKGLCDDPVYINPENGYKITRYLEGVRVADSENVSDLKRCMKKLKQFHEMNLQVPHTFDVFGQIEFYESLWGGHPSVYRDYIRTRDNVMSLKGFIESQPRKWSLTHIDAVPDNFLFYMDGDEEKLQLTDWEYAGMQDPHVDIAMFCIYSYYNKKQIDRLIRIYFEGECSRKIRAKIYCYVAACGLLWSNWSEYKRWLSVDFSEYSKVQYKYAKDFYQYAIKEIKASDENG